ADRVRPPPRDPAGGADRPGPPGAADPSRLRRQERPHLQRRADPCDVGRGRRPGSGRDHSVTPPRPTSAVTSSPSGLIRWMTAISVSPSALLAHARSGALAALLVGFLSSPPPAAIRRRGSGGCHS